MNRQLTLTERGIIGRTKFARKAAGLKARAVASAIGISISEYRRYEEDQVLPGHLVFAFCAVTRCSPHYLSAGAGQIGTPNKVLAPRNPCGTPCPHHHFWCHALCDTAPRD